jgi:hypothetical protein
MKTKLLNSPAIIAGFVLFFSFNGLQAISTVAAQTSDSSVAAPEAAYQTYLPLTVKHADNADGGDDGGDDGGSNEAGALWLPYTISGDTVLPTYGTSVAVDGKARKPGEDKGSPPGSGPQNR